MSVKSTQQPRQFPTGPNLADSIDDVLLCIDAIDPVRYDKTRNYLDGAVTWLSPYITHGVINTSTVAERVLAQHAPKTCYRLLYELAWREYFHRIWQEYDDAIFCDMYHAQMSADSHVLPQAIVLANTGIHVLDEGLRTVQTTGWMHNHMRMWVAGTTCNVAHTHWKLPAKWLYFHLLDGDLASNTLSWQWIAGTFSHKQYIANQENINKYSRTEQHGTWLDVSYETLANMPTPEALGAREYELVLSQTAPGSSVPEPDSVIGSEPLRKKFGLRSLWNLNPNWLADDKEVVQVLFIEQDQVNEWPMSSHRWEFIQHWSDQLGIDVWLGSVDQLTRLESAGVSFVREEYPACAHWPGAVMDRTFHFPVPEDAYRSFSQFWKQVK